MGGHRGGSGVGVWWVVIGVVVVWGCGGWSWWWGG